MEVDRFSFNMMCQQACVVVRVLIDTGAVLNVVSSEFARKYKLKLQECRNIIVKFGNGETSDSKYSTSINLIQGSYAQKIEFFVADMHIPVIVGMPWVSAVQITKIDWSSRLVLFHDGEKLHSLTGEAPEFLGTHPQILS